MPAAVFLGMHLLFTDPSTSPRSELGRIIYGVMYGLGVVALYGLLGQIGAPTFYDKLLAVPLMNMTIQLIDVAARSAFCDQSIRPGWALRSRRASATWRTWRSGPSRSQLSATQPSRTGPDAGCPSGSRPASKTDAMAAWYFQSSRRSTAGKGLDGPATNWASLRQPAAPRKSSRPGSVWIARTARAGCKSPGRRRARVQPALRRQRSQPQPADYPAAGRARSGSMRLRLRALRPGASRGRRVQSAREHLFPGTGVARMSARRRSARTRLRAEIRQACADFGVMLQRAMALQPTPTGRNLPQDCMGWRREIGLRSPRWSRRRERTSSDRDPTYGAEPLAGRRNRLRRSPRRVPARSASLPG